MASAILTIYKTNGVEYCSPSISTGSRGGGGGGAYIWRENLLPIPEHTYVKFQRKKCWTCQNYLCVYFTDQKTHPKIYQNRFKISKITLNEPIWISFLCNVFRCHCHDKIKISECGKIDCTDFCIFGDNLQTRSKIFNISAIFCDFMLIIHLLS